MQSKLQVLCAQLRAQAEITENITRELAAISDACRTGHDRVQRLYRGSRRAGEVIGQWSIARRLLSQDAVPRSANAALALRRLAAALCGDGTSATGDPARVLSAPPVTLDVVGDPHGGHGGPGVPAARAPVEDITRERVDKLLDTADGPNDLSPELVGFRYDWVDAGGHAGQRHNYVVAGESKQKDRCMNGIDPITGNTTDWETGKSHKYSKKASAFVSQASLVFAEAKVFTSPEGISARQTADQFGEYRMVINVPAKRIFGATFRDHIVGWERVGTKRNPTGTTPATFADDTMIRAVYHRHPAKGQWYLHTMFPSDS